MGFDTQNTERVRRYSKGQVARGLSRLSLWVPSNRVNDARRHAAQLRRSEGILLPRDSAASEQASGLSPVPTGSEISSAQLLELMAAARDEPPEKTLTDICVGRGPLGTAATLARIAGRLGYTLVWRQEIADELAELRSQWIGSTQITALASTQRRAEKSAALQPRSIDLPTSAAPVQHSRNGPCPCGSGKKYKRCCAEP